MSEARHSDVQAEAIRIEQHIGQTTAVVDNSSNANNSDNSADADEPASENDIGKRDKNKCNEHKTKTDKDKDKCKKDKSNGVCPSQNP